MTNSPKPIVRRRALLLAALTVAVSLATAVAAPATAEARMGWKGPDSPYQLDPALEIGLLAVGVPLWGVPHAIEGDLEGARCGQPGNLCDISKVPSFDRSLMFHNTSLRAPADAIFNFAPLVILPALFLDYGPGSWRGYLADTLIVVESWAWSGAITHIFRYAVRRPRPFLYDADVQEGRTGPDPTMSFFSGHVSELFGFGVSAAYLMTLRRGASWRTGVLWGVVIGMGAAVAVMRVGSGDHFASDVAVGAVVGSGIGLLVPSLHTRRARAVTALSVVPVIGDGYRGVSVAARF